MEKRKSRVHWFLYAQGKYSGEAVLQGKSVITKLCPQHTRVWGHEDVCSFVTHPAATETHKIRWLRATLA